MTAPDTKFRQISVFFTDEDERLISSALRAAFPEVVFFTYPHWWDCKQPEKPSIELKESLSDCAKVEIAIWFPPPDQQPELVWEKDSWHFKQIFYPFARFWRPFHPDLRKRVSTRDGVEHLNETRITFSCLADAPDHLAHARKAFRVIEKCCSHEAQLVRWPTLEREDRDIRLPRPWIGNDARRWGLEAPRRGFRAEHKYGWQVVP